MAKMDFLKNITANAMDKDDEPVKEEKVTSKVKKEEKQAPEKKVQAKEEPKAIAPKKQEIEAEEKKEEETPVNNLPTKKVKDGGKKERTSVSLPSEDLKIANIAAQMNFGSNLSEYIGSLIKKDLAENGEKYKKFQDLMSQFKN